MARTWTDTRRACLIDYPGYERVWLYNARLEGDLVVGELTIGGKRMTMNFPRAAIVRWSIDSGR